MPTRWPLHSTLASVTARVSEKSAAARQAYLQRIASAAGSAAARGRLSCANLAHVAAAGDGEGDGGDQQKKRGNSRFHEDPLGGAVSIIRGMDDMDIMDGMDGGTCRLTRRSAVWYPFRVLR